MTQKDWSKAILEIFGEICRIPRPSGHEEKIGEYLTGFAAKRNLEHLKDNAGNILIRKQASPGMENRRTVILQAHQDMVCEKDAAIEHDFMRDSIETYTEGGWLKARGTTLGADDGIGIAMALAVLDDEAIKHGPIECLFTVSEETGLCGAENLQPGMMNGNMLINLDSEDEGQIFIGCAGGVTTDVTFKFSKESIPDNYFFIEITVDKLHGGHSGDDIDKGYANANKILARFLYNTMDKYDIRLCSFNGGNLHNAIPRCATARIALPDSFKENIRVDFNIFADIVQKEYHVTETGMEFRMSSTDRQDYCIDTETSHKLIMSIHSAVNGVFAMSMDIPGLVETSSNLASVKTGDGTIKIVASHRSSVESAIQWISSVYASAFRLAGAEVRTNDAYPGWTPNTDSELLKISVDTYRRLFGRDPEVRAIHAGLECGLFLKAYPGLDMISVGPTLRGVHSPTERLELKTVGMVFDHLLAILEEIPE